MRYKVATLLLALAWTSVSYAQQIERADRPVLNTLPREAIVNLEAVANKSLEVTPTGVILGVIDPPEFVLGEFILKDGHIPQLDALEPIIREAVSMGFSIAFEGHSDEVLYVIAKQYADVLKKFSVNAEYQAELGQNRGDVGAYYGVLNMGLNPEYVTSITRPGDSEDRTIVVKAYPAAWSLYELVGLLQLEIEGVLDKLEDLEEDHDEILTAIMKMDLEPARLNEIVTLLSAMREEQQRQWEEERRRDDALLEALEFNHWTAGVGYASTSEFSEGYVFSLGRHLPGSDVSFTLEFFAENDHHRADLLYRPHPNVETPHYGPTYIGTLFVRKGTGNLLGDGSISASIFAEGGIGAVHNRYEGVEGSQSIGFHHTAFAPALGLGAELQISVVSLDLRGRQRSYKFPWSKVDPATQEDSGFQTSFEFVGTLVVHLGREGL